MKRWIPLGSAVLLLVLVYLGYLALYPRLTLRVISVTLQEADLEEWHTMIDSKLYASSGNHHKQLLVTCECTGCSPVFHMEGVDVEYAPGEQLPECILGKAPYLLTLTPLSFQHRRTDRFNILIPLTPGSLSDSELLAQAATVRIHAAGYAVITEDNIGMPDTTIGAASNPVYLKP